MINVGQINHLKIDRQTDFGYFLDAADYGSVLLPKNLVKTPLKVGESVDAMLYFDSDNQLCATCEEPIAQVGQWGLMKVVGVNATGAFVDWGIKAKDLLIPFSEQRRRFAEGQTVLVYVYTDKASGRIVGTTKFNKLLDKTPATYENNQKVSIVIAEKSDLGYKAIVEGTHWGMIFTSDVFGKLFIGKTLSAYIKDVRDDGKITLSLQKMGVAKFDELSERILDLLNKKDGYLPISDKSSPEAIFDLFRTSKGTFKKSIGTLYKARKITIERDGIRLADSE
ncbi:GntR family transcriptional regulator [Vibrio sp. qd031]|uniref:CvfB family protein n=1 Tax=Vibrio sp. qd031 TaxID=1603038 RepID=UPI000A11DCE2|nr:S1-like domain-containing RNA-binding protein [Vibrio sp. qd031]ORT49786.1 GntR family transcriptional regulator [Vibrio sp. qd031]